MAGVGAGQPGRPALLPGAPSGAAPACPALPRRARLDFKPCVAAPQSPTASLPGSRGTFLSFAAVGFRPPLYLALPLQLYGVWHASEAGHCALPVRRSLGAAAAHTPNLGAAAAHAPNLGAAAAHAPAAWRRCGWWLCLGRGGRTAHSWRCPPPCRSCCGTRSCIGALVRVHSRLLAGLEASIAPACSLRRRAPSLCAQHPLSCSSLSASSCLPAAASVHGLFSFTFEAVVGGRHVAAMLAAAGPQGRCAAALLFFHAVLSVLLPLLLLLPWQQAAQPAGGQRALSASARLETRLQGWLGQLLWRWPAPAGNAAAAQREDAGGAGAGLLAFALRWAVVLLVLWSACTLLTIRPPTA